MIYMISARIRMEHDLNRKEHYVRIQLKVLCLRDSYLLVCMFAFSLKIIFKLAFLTVLP